jgi:hypothetical protein
VYLAAAVLQDPVEVSVRVLGGLMSLGYQICTNMCTCLLPCCRIQFEVSVRVLGGLMSLGYQIGTIMRRTSTIVSSGDGGTSVKFDDVENLGKYVQVRTAGEVAALYCFILLPTMQGKECAPTGRH